MLLPLVHFYIRFRANIRPHPCRSNGHRLTVRRKLPGAFIRKDPFTAPSDLNRMIVNLPSRSRYFRNYVRTNNGRIFPIGRERIGKAAIT